MLIFPSDTFDLASSADCFVFRTNPKKTKTTMLAKLRLHVINKTITRNACMSVFLAFSSYVDRRFCSGSS